ncbi:hypothetical protein J2X76_006136 [Neorhizobium sp. 2083]|uniref:hypothetical protein n=1 Tax=Neorhizobium sp. 2083 TaxID=2817762 RepID=UPI002855C2DC|nr:hypothetical protein [Neorhizobium sp. 2083]MDR6820936.1 hypothetical protein [Neorhizobium sp. 2083]
MPSKKYSQHLCVYCRAKHSTPTADHIFAREFFLIPDRGSLPKAPCCGECGAEKSKDEHYLTAVLPFGGLHSGARENLTTMVPKRLARNKKLHQELAVGMRISEVGKPTVVPLDTSRLERLFERITVGLVWHHWECYLPATHRVEAALLSPHGEAFFDSLFAMPPKERAFANLGNGTIEYAGARSHGEETFSIWRYRVYGGLQMTGDIDAPNVTSHGIGCMTASNGFFERNPFKSHVR